MGEWEGEGEEECDFSCLHTIYQNRVLCYFTSEVFIQMQRVGWGSGRGRGRGRRRRSK